MENLERLLLEHPFFKDMAPEHVRFLTGCARNQRFDTGAYLAREGQEANTTLLVRRGRVALEIHQPAGGPRNLQTVEEGEVIGWSWLFPPYQWHFDARALSPTLVLAFDGSCLRKKCEEDTRLGYELLKRLLFTVHKRLERSRFQLVDMYKGPRDAAGAEAE